MLTLGILGSGGGQGKSSILSMISLWEGRQRFKAGDKPLCVLDGDIASPYISALLLGRFPPLEVRTFEDYLLYGVREIMYSPNPRQLRDPEKVSLIVIPSGCKYIPEISKMPARQLHRKIEELKSMLDGKVGRLYIDFPAGHVQLASLSAALAMSIDYAILVTRPSLAHIHALRRVWDDIQQLETPPELAAVIINQYSEDQPYDPKSGERWDELVWETFGLKPTLIPDDPEWRAATRLDTIPLLRTLEKSPANAIVVKLAEMLYGKPSTSKPKIASPDEKIEQLKRSLSMMRKPEGIMARIKEKFRLPIRGRKKRKIRIIVEE